MNILKKVVCVITLVALTFTVCSCSKIEKKKDEKPAVNDEIKNSDADIIEVETVSESDVSTPVEPSTEEVVSNDTSSDATGGKYAGVETYVNDKGNKAAKTDSGVEVEITAENFEQLMTEYQVVSETDPQRAKELLDQIQIFFDNMNEEGFME